MVAGKGLILKSLLGVSAVGGGVTVVAVGHKEGWLSTLGTTTTTDAGQGGAGGGAGAPGATGSGAQVSQVTPTGADDQAETNNKLTPLGLPEKCKFSSEKKDKVDCDVSKEALVKIAFKDKEESQDLTIETGQDDFTGMKIEVRKLTEDEKSHYDSSSSIDLVFTFKSFSKTITLKKDTTEVVKLVKGTDPVFKIVDQKKLEKIFSDESSICQKVNLSCENGNNVTIKTSSEIPFLESGQIKKYKIKETSEITDKITVTKDSEDYSQGFKFSTTGDVEFKNSDNTEISGDDAKKLKASKDYQILFKDGASGGWYLAEKPAPAA